MFKSLYSKLIDIKFQTVQDKRLLLLKLQPENEYHAGVYSNKPKINKTMVHLVFKFQKNKKTGAVRAKCLGIVSKSLMFCL